jgi:hypothetical protein
LQRILDLYLEGDFSKDLLIEKKARLEHTIQSLQLERENLKEIANTRTITPEQVQSIQDFSRKIIEELDIMSCDFQAKKKIIDLLNVEVICMTNTDGEKLIKTKCILGENQYHVSIDSRDRNADV